MAEGAEIGSRMSSITRLAKNLSTSVDIAKNTEVDESDSSDDETVKKSSLLKNSNIPIEYLTSLCSKKRCVFFDSCSYS